MAGAPEHSTLSQRLYGRSREARAFRSGDAREVCLFSGLQRLPCDAQLAEPWCYANPLAEHKYMRGSELGSGLFWLSCVLMLRSILLLDGTVNAREARPLELLGQA
jgi:hypothetical protein